MQRFLASLLFVGVLIALDIRLCFATDERIIVLNWTVEGVSEYTARYNTIMVMQY